MSHSGADLGVDLANLWEAGHYQLRPLASEFRLAAGRLLLTDTGEGNLYRDAKLGGPYGSAYPAFEALRDAVFETLRTTAENLDLTGEALVTAAQEYARTDDDAGKKFESLQPGLAAVYAPAEEPK